MKDKEKLALKIANNYLGCELSQLNHVERNIINLTIDVTEQEILLEVGKTTQKQLKSLLNKQAKEIKEWFKTRSKDCRMFYDSYEIDLDDFDRKWCK